MMKYRIIIAVLTMLCMSATYTAFGAGLSKQFQPYISLKEEYTDNLNLTSENELNDSITTIQPGLKFLNMDETSGIDLDYMIGLVYYRNNNDLNYVSHNGSLSAKYLTKNRINFFLKESFIRSEDPREQEFFTTTADNRYVLSTQRERAVYWRNVIAPTAEYQFGAENRLGINYRNNTYRTDNTASQDSQENFINPYLSYWFNKQNGIFFDYGFTDGDFQINPHMTGHKANARYTYRFDAKSSVFAEYAFTRRTFESPGLDYDVHEPVLGIIYSLSPRLMAMIQASYYWMEPDTGSKQTGFGYMGELHNLDPRTTYQLSLQGGYTEDYFTSQNLGFNKYHRLTGSVKHMLEKNISVGGLGSIERAEYSSGQNDTIWGVTGTGSYMLFKWLALVLEVSHRATESNVASSEYAENRAMFLITATY